MSFYNEESSTHFRILCISTLIITLSKVYNKRTIIEIVVKGWDSHQLSNTLIFPQTARG